MTNLGIHKTAIRLETKELTAQDRLISSYFHKVLRNRTVTVAEFSAWNVRMAELRSLQAHSVNCFCYDCNDRWAINNGR